MRSIPPLLLPLLLLCLGLILPATAFAGDDWRPVDPSDLALKAPVVEKDADAEAIFWEVRFANEPMDKRRPSLEGNFATFLPYNT